MIKNQYVADCEGTSKFVMCASCGKYGDDDPKMIRLHFSYKDRHKHDAYLYLCDECRQLLYKTI